VYLVHSIGHRDAFWELEQCCARNFGDAALRAGVKRIVYLGGIAPYWHSRGQLAGREVKNDA